MAAPANELQAAIYGLLTTDSEVQALVDTRVYDQPPSANVAAPYITFGPSDETQDDSACIQSAEHSLQIDVWSEKKGGFKECKEITFAVKQALHEVDVVLPTHALVEMQVIQRRHVRDPDGITSHGIVIVSAMVEEN